MLPSDYNNKTSEREKTNNTNNTRTKRKTRKKINNKSRNAQNDLACSLYTTDLSISGCWTSTYMVTKNLRLLRSTQSSDAREIKTV